jgi:hypothetical protein
MKEEIKEATGMENEMLLMLEAIADDVEGHGNSPVLVQLVWHSLWCYVQNHLELGHQQAKHIAKRLFSRISIYAYNQRVWVGFDHPEVKLLIEAGGGM